MDLNGFTKFEFILKGFCRVNKLTRRGLWEIYLRVRSD